MWPAKSYSDMPQGKPTPATANNTGSMPHTSATGQLLPFSQYFCAIKRVCFPGET